MRPILGHKSFQAAGCLIAVAAIIAVRSRLGPAGHTAGEVPDPGPPQRSHSARSLRPGAPSVSPAFSGDLNSDPQPFLPALAEIASHDPRKALANLAAIQDPDLLPPALAAVASGWARLDLHAAANWVAGISSESQRSEAEAGLISVWAASDPANCLAWIVQHPTGNLRDESLVKLAETWCSNDPQEALSRFLGLEIDDGSRRGVQAIVSQWAKDDPAAVGYIGALDESPRRDEILEAALISLASQDPELAWTCSDRFTDQKYTDRVRGMALESMAGTRPQEALELAESGGNGETLLAGIARGWFASHDSSAMEWIDSLPDPDLAARLRAEAFK